MEGLRRNDSTTQALKRRGWLPGVSRSELRVVVLTYGALRLGSPLYLAGLLSTSATASSSDRVLRSQSNDTLSVYRTRTRIGDRAFVAAAPRLWNLLLQDIRTLSGPPSSFRDKVSGYYFSLIFD